MERRRAGGLELSVIGLGTYALSGAYGPPDPARFRQVVEGALEAGVTLFDTSDAYGEAEEFLGRILRPHRSGLIIVTKFGVREGVHPRLDRESIVQACEGSLRRLGVRRIDLYQIHFDDPSVDVHGPVEALEFLVRAGKIGAYGLGHTTPGRAVEYLSAGRFTAWMTELSLVERDALGGMTQLCQERGIGIMAFSVTGRGLLSGRVRHPDALDRGDIRRIDPLFQRERLQSALRVADRLGRLARARELPPAALAVAWVLAQPAVVCALTGPGRVEHLRENLQGAEVRLHPEELEELDRIVRVEEVRLRRELTRTSEVILEGPLPPEAGRAISDLVYAVETAVKLGRLREDEAIPALRTLLVLRRKGDPTAAALDAVRSEVAVLVRPEPDAPPAGDEFRVPGPPPASEEGA